jgi:hypothetical protein
VVYSREISFVLFGNLSELRETETLCSLDFDLSVWSAIQKLKDSFEQV